MLLSLLGLKATGLRRSHVFFVFVARFFKRSFAALNKFLLVLTFIGMTAYCMFLSINQHPLIAVAQNFLMDVTSPALYFLHQPFVWLKDYFHHHEHLREELIRLRIENRKLLEWQVLAQKRERENQYLREMLNTEPDLSDGAITAKILGIPNDGFHTSMLISNSLNLSIEKNQVVVCPEGVIGRVVDLGRKTARVMLVTDFNSRIPVRVESTGEHAILAGHSTPNELTVIHISGNSSNPDVSSFKKDAIKIGDRLLTSGYGGIYPPGLPVAVVNKVEGDYISANVLADITRLEYVTVLKNVIDEDLE
jgi:rod shape-determining protein MreC